jgi:hypothetical protein
LADNKAASAETDGAPFVGADVVRISRFNGSIWENFRVTGTNVASFINVAGAITAHESAGDPHPQYLTAAEGDALFLTPAEGNAAYDALGAATAAVAAHEAAGNPHPVYLTQAEADALYAALVHATRHQAGGADPIKLDDLAAPDDNVDLNASLTAHGLMQKYPGGTANFLRADGTFAAPPAGAGSLTSGTTTVNFGAFPGKHEATVDVTGQTGLVSTTRIWAWIQPIATADHSLDEHVEENIQAMAYYVADGTLRIRANATNYLHNRLPRQDRQADPARCHGLFTVGWAWIN